MCKVCNDELKIWEDMGYGFSVTPCPQCNADGQRGKERWEKELVELEKKLLEGRKGVVAV